MKRGGRSELHVSDSWVISPGMKQMMRQLLVSGAKGTPTVSLASGNGDTNSSTDNSISLLYSQPVSALQILTPEGEWKWVKHVEGSVVVNTADALECKSKFAQSANSSLDRRGVQSDPT